MDEDQPRMTAVAVAQLPAVLNDPSSNIEATAREIASAGGRGDALIVFPECHLSGYMYGSADDVRRSALSLDDPSLAPLMEACKRSGAHAVVGLLERDGNEVFNTAVTLGPSGILGSYRKQHLPFMGADRFVSPGRGSSPRVVSTPFGKVGVMICFDLRFPESARELALQGAEIIAMPTAWPERATFLADHVTRVRAVENLLFLAVADRADRENGAQYLGRSQIVAPDGAVVIDAGHDSGVFSADIDLSAARRKRLVFVPDEDELDVFGARRPDLYGELVKPTVPAQRHPESTTREQ